MASEDGPQTGAVTLFEAVAETPWRFGLLSLLRRIECNHPQLPGLGHSARPSDDPVRLSQEPYNAFASSTLTALRQDKGSLAPRVVQTFFGAFGPDGPLPSHLTEVARDRERQHRDPTFARFVDLFHHRLISLFYRAWAQAQPTVQFDRPETDRFATYVASLLGLGAESLRHADDMPFEAKLSFSGHLGSLPRLCAGLEALISEYFQVKARVTEFIAHSLRIPKQDHLLLGRERKSGRLGLNSVLGERVTQRQDKFRITLGPMGLEEYTAFLPSGKSFKALVAAVRNYVGMEMLWEVEPVLKRDEKPVTCLGKSGRLGWTSWLESGETEEDARDLLLQVRNYVH